jgi:hypothetical protein
MNKFTLPYNLALMTNPLGDTCLLGRRQQLVPEELGGVDAEEVAGDGWEELHYIYPFYSMSGNGTSEIKLCTSEMEHQKWTSGKRKGGNGTTKTEYRIWNEVNGIP